MKRIKICIYLILQITLISAQNEFSFVFLPDLHLHSDSAIEADFDILTGQINKLGPDFVLTGGDMIYTAKNVDDRKAKILFNYMDEEFKLFKMPVFLTMGNHETVGITQESGIDKSNPEWGKQMYENRYTKRYYSFNYKGWKFFILDGIKILEKEINYTQGVDSVQIDWIRDELLKTNKDVPIVISIHTPLINPQAISNSQSQALSVNAEAVLNLFRDYNLRIVLQGHNHIYMNLFINGIHYISGGSASYGTDQVNNGFILVRIMDDVEEIQFIHTIRQSE